MIAKRSVPDWFQILLEFTPCDECKRRAREMFHEGHSPEEIEDAFQFIIYGKEWDDGWIMNGEIEEVHNHPVE